ncbi:MAG: DUF1801 domain-containing protein [Candidatus Hydrogenedentes bacterium]|nr:DUF1801 domain-containing protein [Candidatus Hydrogenedentota bacterium]
MTTSGKQQTIDDYISAFPENIREILEKMKSTIRSAAPKAEEAIKYGIPTFTLNGKNLAHFAAFKNHIGFYPTPSAIEAFKKELSEYKQSKGAIQFPLEKAIPFGVVKKIVKFRVKESEKRK